MNKNSLKRLILGFTGLITAGNVFASGNLPFTNGLSLWLSADVGVTNTGGNVGGWADQSGAGHSAIQSILPNQPTLVPNQLNGHPVIHFVGGQFFQLLGQVITSSNFTILAVARDQRTDTSFRELISNWNDSNGNQGSSVFFGTTGLNPVRVRFSDDFGGAGQGQAGVGTVANPTNGFILTGVNAADHVAVYQNLTNIAYRATPLGGRNLIGPYAVGRQGNGTFDEYWHGDIAEMIVFNRELSSSELNTLWDYYATKYVLGLGPVLTIAPTNSSNFAVYWPSPSTGLVLQESTNLNAGSWTNSTNSVNDDGKTRSVIVNRASSRKFFRLKE